MKVKITKSIDIADKAPSMPTVTVVEGEIRTDLSDHVANRLIELGWAVEVSEDESTVVATEKVEGFKGVVVTPDTLRVELEAIVTDSMSGVMGSKIKAKKALEAFGKERYKFDVDKSLKVENVVSAIVEAAFPTEDK